MTKIITSITAQKKNARRMNIYINHEYAFALSSEKAASLQKGSEISQERIDSLKQADKYDKGYLRALNYLKSRPRSRNEINRYLTDKKIETGIISSIISRLESEGYINDLEFARWWVENRLRFRPRGIFALRYELKNKGISDVLIDSTTREIDEAKTAWKAVLPKLNLWRKLEKSEFKKKIYDFLTRKGFGYGICNEIYEKALQNKNPDRHND